jgi:hypothetical protein
MMDYKAVLTAEQKKKGNTLTLADLESAMDQHWRSIGNGDLDDDEN